MLKKTHILANLLTLLALSFFPATNSLATNNSHQFTDASATSGDKENSSTNAAMSEQDLQKMATVIAEIKKYYVKPISDHEIFDNAISGMLNGLDPHSEYLKKDDLDSLEMLTIGKFGGIGVEVIPDQGLIKIISPIDDTPAAKAGIKAGDTIIKIDNKLVKDMRLNEAIKLMRGSKGSKLTLTILRKNASKPLVINLKRDIIKIQSVKEQMLEPEFGYLRVSFFQESTGNDVIKAINKLKKQNEKTSDNDIKGLILDLRNNPGGLLDSAVQVADSFLDTQKLGSNNIIVYTKGNSENSKITARATPGELLPNVPIVVLINEGSASAAEIVAGALQDYKRAVIVGTKSFGKGSVQTVLPVDKESAIKLTTSLYYTPLGRSIQAKGIEPDITISDLKLQAKNNGNDEEQDIANISESSFIDHLKNGNDENDDDTNTETTTSQGTNASKDSSTNHETDNKESKDTTNKSDLSYDLVNKDYQLHEALNILKALNVTHHKNK